MVESRVDRTGTLARFAAGRRGPVRRPVRACRDAQDRNVTVKLVFRKTVEQGSDRINSGPAQHIEGKPHRPIPGVRSDQTSLSRSRAASQVASRKRSADRLSTSPNLVTTYAPCTVGVCAVGYVPPCSHVSGRRC